MIKLKLLVQNEKQKGNLHLYIEYIYICMYIYGIYIYSKETLKWEAIQIFTSIADSMRKNGSGFSPYFKSTFPHIWNNCSFIMLWPCFIWFTSFDTWQFPALILAKLRYIYRKISLGLMGTHLEFSSDKWDTVVPSHNWVSWTSSLKLTLGYRSGLNLFFCWSFNLNENKP